MPNDSYPLTLSPLIDEKHCFKDTPFVPVEEKLMLMDEVIDVIAKELQDEKQVNSIRQYMLPSKDFFQQALLRQYLHAISRVLKKELLPDWNAKEKEIFIFQLRGAVVESTSAAEFLKAVENMMVMILVPCILGKLDEEQKKTFIIGEDKQYEDKDEKHKPNTIYDHAGPQATFTGRSKLIEYLWIITRVLIGEIRSYQDTEIESYPYIVKLMEGVPKCTNGFYDRLFGMVVGLQMPTTVDELLARMRLDIVEDLALKTMKDPEWKEDITEGDEVHVRQKFFDEAHKRGF